MLVGVFSEIQCTIPYSLMMTSVFLLSRSVRWSHVFSSFMSLYNRAASVVCPPVCPSVNFCANRFFSRANGRIVTKLAHDRLQVSVHPGCAQGQGQGQRSRDTGTFVLACVRSFPSAAVSGDNFWRAAKTGSRRCTPVTFGRQPAQVFSRTCRRTQSVLTQRRNF